MREKLTTIVLSSALVSVTSAAHAGSVTATFDQFTYGRNVKVKLNGYANVNTVAGVFEWDVTGQSDPVHSVCIELTEYISPGQTVTYNVVPMTQAPDPGNGILSPGASPMSAAQADMLREFWTAHWSDIDSDNEAAAFQLGVWEIVFDFGSLDILNGGLTFSRRLGTSYTQWNNIKSLTSSWLADVQSNTYNHADLVAWSVVGKQDHLTEGLLPVDATPIPTPAAAGVGLLGFGAMAMRRRRRTL